MRLSPVPFLLSFAFCFQMALLAQQQRDADKGAKWETLTGCRLMTNAAVDGDSFHLMHKNREYIFRLYFVDAPESDPTLKDRIDDQSAYFGVAPEDIPHAGKLAARFTRDKLAAGPITVITRWQNAMGRSSLARFYAVVVVNNHNLAEELVANGLARIYGYRANWPDGPRSITFINKLKNLELTAREQKRGIWDQSVFPRAGDVSMPARKVAGSPPASAQVDINTATADELEELPGIGPKLAERIIAHRPYKTIEDLDKVPGVGTATIERLRPRIRVTSHGSTNVR